MKKSTSSNSAEYLALYRKTIGSPTTLGAILLCVLIITLVVLAGANTAPGVGGPKNGGHRALDEEKAAGPSGRVPASGVPALTVPAIHPEALVFRDKAQSGTIEKLWTFAEPAYVSASNGEFGQWEDHGENRWVWRLFVQAPGATDINIGFTNISLPRGCSLRLLSTDRTYQVGPYTFDDNAEHGQLWTPVLPGESVVIEAEMPASVADEFVLVIGQVNSGYRDVLRRGFPNPDKQGSCNIDVVCPEADAWRNEIRSVALYSVNGTAVCTGSLIMNQRADFRAFFLTAAHCVDTIAEAASLVVYWNFQSPLCDFLCCGDLSQSQSGSSLRATFASTDFTLLELSSVPSTAFNVYYAGWDRSGAAAASSVAIHHPGGDEKAFSFYDSAVQSTPYLSSTVSSGASHWRVVDWNIGTTETGSSGCGLWHATSHRIIGQLHGGYAACGNNLDDWFGKLSVSWTGGGTTASRLSSWLDPDSTGLTGMNGANPGGTSNDQCAGALVLANNVVRSMNTDSATSTGDPTPTCLSSVGKGVWYSYTPSSSGVVTINTCGSDFDTVVQVYTGTCGSLTALSGGCVDDNGPSCTGTRASVRFNGTAGATYRIMAGGFSSDSGNLQIVASSSSTAPEIEVRGNGLSIADGDSTPATGDGTAFGTTPIGRPVSRIFTVYNLGTAALTISGLTVPSGFTLSEGLTASIAAGGSDTFTVRQNASAAGTYQGDVRFSNNDANENPFNFRITVTVEMAPDSLTMLWSTGGVSCLEVSGPAGRVFQLQGSPDLFHWALLGRYTNQLGTLVLTSTPPAGWNEYFFRTLVASNDSPTNGLGPTLGPIHLLPDGSVRLQMTGAPGTAWRLQGSPDLRHWGAYGVVTNAGGSVWMTNTPLGKAPRYFFRADQP